MRAARTAWYYGAKIVVELLGDQERPSDLSGTAIRIAVRLIGRLNIAAIVSAPPAGNRIAVR